MKRKFLFSMFCICISIIIIAGVTVYATALYFKAEKVDYSILVNNTQLTFSLPVVGIEGRTYVPLREFCELMGYDITWAQEDQKVEISADAAKQPTNAPGLKDFAFLQEGTDIRIVYEKFGQGDEIIGSGCPHDRYYLKDGSKIGVQTNCTDYYVRSAYWSVEEDGEWLAWSIIWDDQHFGKAVFEFEETGRDGIDTQRKFKDFMFIEDGMEMSKITEVLGAADKVNSENDLQHIYHIDTRYSIILIYDGEEKLQKAEIYLAEGAKFAVKINAATKPLEPFV